MFNHVSLEIIKMFNDYPKHQLSFVETALSKQIEVPNDVKLKFLTDLLTLKPEKAIKVLKLYQFPIDESIRLCKKYFNREGTAYLYMRNGKFQDAVQEYTEIIKQSRRDFIKSENDIKHENYKILAKLFYSFDETLILLKDYQEEDKLTIYYKFLCEILDEYDYLQHEEYFKKNLNTRLKAKQFKQWFHVNVVQKMLLDTIVNFGASRFATILSYVDNIDKKMENPEYELFNKLKMIDFRLAEHKISSDYKMLDEVIYSQSLDLLAIKENFQEVHPRGRAKLPHCAVTQEDLKSSALLFECEHPVDLIAIKSMCTHVSDYVCPRCGYQDTLSKNYLTKFSPNEVQTLI